MPVRFKCPTCQTLLEVDESARGMQAQCQSCGSTTVVPAVAAATIGSRSPTPATTQGRPQIGSSAKTRIQCPKCTRVLSAPHNSFGKRLKCPCGALLTLPAQGAAPPASSGDTSSPLSLPPPSMWSSAPQPTNFTQPTYASSAAGYQSETRTSRYAPHINSVFSTNPPASLYLAQAEAAVEGANYDERGESWSPDWAKVGGGLLAMTGSAIWLLAMFYNGGRIRAYPFVLFIGGLLAVIKGIFDGD